MLVAAAQLGQRALLVPRGHLQTGQQDQLDRPDCKVPQVLLVLVSQGHLALQVLWGQRGQRGLEVRQARVSVQQDQLGRKGFKAQQGQQALLDQLQQSRALQDRLERAQQAQQALKAQLVQQVRQALAQRAQQAPLQMLLAQPAQPAQRVRLALPDQLQQSRALQDRLERVPLVLQGHLAQPVRPDLAA